MAPLPKPPNQRRRRNVDQGRWKTLPAEAAMTGVPDLPAEYEWLESTRLWWVTLWASPMASMYVEADIDGLLDLARLRDDNARSPLQGSRRNTKTQLEDRFGLSPKARRALQWEIERADGAIQTVASSDSNLRLVVSK